MILKLFKKLFKKKNKNLACPDCKCESFYMGPEHGGSQNIECVQCNSKFDYSPPFSLERIGGKWEVIK